MNIVLTGSSTGIGRHLAVHLCAQGHVLWGIARSDQSGFERDCAARGQAFHPMVCDVSNWEQVAGCLADLRNAAVELDGLICCAGAQAPIGSAMTLDPLAWSRNIRLNLDGTFFCIRALHELLALSRRAKIICFSGGGATGPRPNFSAYACGKAGIVRLVETLAAEWSDQAIDINAVAPGAINTAMTDEVLALGIGVVGEREFAAAQKQKAAGGTALDKILGLVNFLLSPESDGVSGKLISAPWDPWANLREHRDELAKSDIYCLRRIVPEDRGQKWS